MSKSDNNPSILKAMQNAVQLLEQSISTLITDKDKAIMDFKSPQNMGSTFDYKEVNVDFSMEKGIAYVDTVKYSQKAVLAIYNIARFTLKPLKKTGIFEFPSAVKEAYDEKALLIDNFNYLDESWVPYIVDEKTYQAGIALQKFLEEFLQIKFEAILGYIPLSSYLLEKPVRQMRGYLNNMKSLLSRRLNFYKISNNSQLSKFLEKEIPEHLFEESKAFEDRNREPLLEEIKVFEDKFEKKLRVFEKIIDKLKTSEQIKDAQEKIKTFTDEWSEEKKKYEKWEVTTQNLILSELQSLALYKDIYKFIEYRELMNTIIKQKEQKGATEEAKVFQEDIKTTKNEIVNSPLFKALKNGISEEQTLKIHFVEKLEKGYSNTQIKHIEISQNLNSIQKRISLIANIIEAYKITRKEFKKELDQPNSATLNNYKTELQSYIKVLESEQQAFNDKLAFVPDDEILQQQKDNHQGLFNKKYEEQIQLVQTEINNVDEQIVLHSEEGRRQLIVDLSNNIIVKNSKLQHAIIEQRKINFQYSKGFATQEKQKFKLIQATQNIISENKKHRDDLNLLNHQSKKIDDLKDRLKKESLATILSSMEELDLKTLLGIEDTHPVMEMYREYQPYTQGNPNWKYLLKILAYNFAPDLGLNDQSYEQSLFLETLEETQSTLQEEKQRISQIIAQNTIEQAEILVQVRTLEHALAVEKLAITELDHYQAIHTPTLQELRQKMSRIEDLHTPTEKLEHLDKLEKVIRSTDLQRRQKAENLKVHKDKIAGLEKNLTTLYKIIPQSFHSELQQFEDELAQLKTKQEKFTFLQAYHALLETVKTQKQQEQHKIKRHSQSVKNSLNEVKNTAPSDSIFNNIKTAQESDDVRRRAVFNFNALPKLNKYLENRKNKFWFKDFLRNTAAFFLGCFYQSDSAKRETYVEELSELLKNTNATDWSEKILNKVIDGKAKFTPRAPDSKESLSYLLGQLENEITADPILSPKPKENLSPTNFTR